MRKTEAFYLWRCSFCPGAFCCPDVVKAEARGEMPPPDVKVVTLKAAPLTVSTELPGRTSAYRIAEVRPQVGGIILKRNYKEGSDVKEGESLYQIDPAPFQATLNSAQAELAKARANAELARLTVNRYKPLLGTNYISRQDYDEAVSTHAQAQAAVGLHRQLFRQHKST